MASPFGHSLVSCYFIKPHGRLSGREQPSLWNALFVMVLASLPDLDILADRFDVISGVFHRTLTHSFFFALWLGCVIALVEALIRKGPLLKRALFYAALLATHPLVDYFTVMPPYGGAMPLFWPIADGFYASPVALLPSAFTYATPIPVLQSYWRTFAAESALILPLAGWEGWKLLRGRAQGGPISTRLDDPPLEFPLNSPVGDP